MVAGAVALALAAMATPAYADTAEGTVEVSATDPCIVRLSGMSENTNGYDEQKKVEGKATFSIAVDEPGEYEYELKQVASQGLETYDTTTYCVWVTAHYEGETMQATVTGGVKGTNDKPDSFEFKKPKKEQPKEEPKEEPKKEETGVLGAIIPSMGDDIRPWVIALVAGVALLALTGTFGNPNGRRSRR